MAATVIGFYGLMEKTHRGRIPTVLHYIYYKLDNGTIIVSNDNDYMAHSWHLIGTRCTISLEAQWERMIEEPRYGIESGLTGHEDQVIQNIRSVDPEIRKKGPPYPIFREDSRHMGVSNKYYPNTVALSMSDAERSLSITGQP
jgi:hypothetical protein